MERLGREKPAPGIIVEGAGRRLSASHQRFPIRVDSIDYYAGERRRAKVRERARVIGREKAGKRGTLVLDVFVVWRAEGKGAKETIHIQMLSHSVR